MLFCPLTGQAERTPDSGAPLPGEAREWSKLEHSANGVTQPLFSLGLSCVGNALTVRDRSRMGHSPPLATTRREPPNVELA